MPSDKAVRLNLKNKKIPQNITLTIGLLERAYSIMPKNMKFSNFVEPLVEAEVRKLELEKLEKTGKGSRLNMGNNS